MEAQKGFRSLLIRSIGVVILSSLALLSPASLGPASVAQTAAYPLIPLLMWGDGHNAVDDAAYGLAVDFQGNAVVVGTSGIIKYSEDGRRLWQAPYAGIAYGVATDSLADIIVAGTGGLVKLTSEGKQLWAIAGEFYKVAAVAGDRIVAVGPDGVRAYTPGGEAQAELAYPGRPYGLAGSGEIVVVIGTAGLAKYDLTTGEELWRVGYGGELRGVALDSAGNAVVVGSEGVSKYSPGGGLIWQQPFLGEPQAVAIIPSREPFQGDEIVVTGGYKGGDWDYRTVKYSPDGEELWEIRYDGGQGDDIAYAVGVSPAGRIYVTGASTLAKAVAGAQAGLPVVDKDYYTIQYGERPLPEALEARGRDQARCSPEGLPRAAFTASNPRPLTGEAISFANRSYDPDGYLLAWSWAFGNGNTSQAWEPQHHYGRKGSYTVTLTVVDNDFCTATAEASIEVGNRPPVADFSWIPLTPTDLEEAIFTPEFEDPDGEITLVRWELGDGTIVEWDSKVEFGPPGQRNPLPHRYPDDGLYFVRLVVTDDDGAEVEVEKEITVLNVPPEASFTWEATPPKADFTWTVDRERHGRYPEGFFPELPELPTDLDDVLFEDLSTPGAICFSGEAADPDGKVVRWHWDFGDESYLEEQNPCHQYRQAATYHVLLTVTDDDGDSSVYEKEVESSGEIVAWEWAGSEIFLHVEPGPEPPWDLYHCSISSHEQNPTAWFEDDCYFELTLTIWDIAGNSDSITKPFFVLNVPPVADFSWHLEQPFRFLINCRDLPPVSPNFACQEPAIPEDAGVVAFSNLSVDSESWHSIEGWEWDFGNEGWICWEPAECASAFEPKVLFTETIGGIEYLFHGEREARLSVWDDDGAGGEDFPSSTTSKTVTVANIPPYAAFTWEDLGNESTLAFPICTARQLCLLAPTPLPGQPPQPYVCIDWNAIGEPGCGGVFSPWSWVAVESHVISTVDTRVEVIEMLPEGWSYAFDVDGDCLTVLEEGSNYWRASIDLATCSGRSTIHYHFTPAFEASLGPYEITSSYTFDNSSPIQRHPQVFLEASVNVTQWMSFHGYSKEDLEFIDPNGDEIVSWDWEFHPRGGGPMPKPPPGPAPTDHGQDPSGDYCDEGFCTFEFVGMMGGAFRCEFDGNMWLWHTELPVSLTVTDEWGDSTTVDAVIPLSGFCGMTPA
jgi:PKD repeat protein